MEQQNEILKKLDEIAACTLLQAKEALSISDVCLLTGYKTQTIYNLIHRNAIPYYRSSHGTRFSKKEITSWLLQHRQPTKAEMLAEEELKQLRRKH